MANKEQIKILKQGGVDRWNAWRRENRDVKVDLSGADFREANLIEADLSRADLSGADLSGADFIGADLRNANLREANLIGAILIDANIREADLNGANLIGAILIGAILGRANLSGATLIDANICEVDLIGTNLSGIDISRANTAGTQFTDVDLSEVEGLDQMEHSGPSSIGIDTIRLSKGKLPVKFLRGCGLSDFEIVAAQLQSPYLTRSEFTDLTYTLNELRFKRPINFHSCFISYSSADTAFAERIYEDLQSIGVRCWYAPEDLKIGEKIRHGIDRAISMHEKLLLIISKDSIESDWVEHEVERALRRERKEKLDILFPIRLDDEIMGIEEGWAASVRNIRYMGDFRKWKIDGDYQKAFERLKKDLQQNGA